MTIGNPVALWLLPVAVTLILLTRRRRSRETRVVGNLFLWTDARSHETAPLARRLRKQWIVILQIASAATLILAIARPLVGWSRSHVAVVVDLSMSMGARDGNRTRFDQARSRAADIAARLPAGTGVHLIAAGVVAVDRGRVDVLDRVLAGMTPTDGRADLDAAVQLARSSGPAHVYVLSDTARPDDSSNDQAVDWLVIGEAADNVAITSLVATRDSGNRAVVHVAVDVTNFGRADISTNVVISHDTAELARRTVHLDAQAGASMVFEIGAVNGFITGRLDVSDALPADNVRYAIVPPQKPLRVRLAGEQADGAVARAVAAYPGVEIVMGASAPVAVGGDRDEDVDDLVVCDGCTSVPATHLRTGVLLVPPRSDTPAEPVLLSMRDVEHPLMPALDVDGLSAVPIPQTIAPDADATVIAVANDAPAIVASERDGRRVLELRLDVDGSDLSLAPAFPVLIANAVEWLSASHRNASAVSAGEAIEWVAGDTSTTDVSITGPRGVTRTLRQESGRLAMAPMEEAGIYHVHGRTRDELFAVNPATDVESDLTRPLPAALASVTASAPTDLLGDASGLLLALVLALLAAEWWLRPAPSALAWRVSTLALVVIALSGIAVRGPRARGATMIVLDRSNSMTATDTSVAARITSALDGLPRDTRVGLTVFGADAAVERRPAPGFDGPIVNSDVGTTSTDIERALRTARAALASEGGGRMLLASDGHQTRGDALREALLAAANGVPIDVLPMPAAHRSARVARLSAPPTGRVGEPLPLVATVEGPAGSPVDVVLDRTPDVPIEQTVAVPAGGLATVSFVDRPSQSGFRVYRARVVSGDPLDPPSAQAGAVVSVDGESRLLYVQGAAAGAAPPLAAAGFRTQRVPPALLPVAASDLDPFDVIVLDEVSTEEIGHSQGVALAGYVEQRGGGLFVLGSSQTLESSTLANHAVGALLPVDLRPRTGQRAPAMALVIAFDKSGSMDDRIEGVTRIEYARQAVARVFEAVPSTDALGVIAFDAEAHEVAPLRSGHDTGDIVRRLAAIRPSGSTAITPAVTLAREWLSSPPAAQLTRRHVLLVTDGRTSADDAMRLEAGVTGMRYALSVVALGAEADRPFLTRLATASGGRAYFPQSIRELPALAAREASRVAGGQTVDTPFRPRGLSHPALRSIDLTTIPALGGYVVSRAKPSAQTLLHSHLDDPILAVWRRGLGAVGVYTAGLHSAWSDRLRQWKGFSALLGQSTRWLSRSVRDATLYARFEETSSGIRIVVEAQDANGTPLDSSDVRAHVRDPRGEAREIRLRSAAPGRYESRFEPRETGPYALTVDTISGDGQFAGRILRGHYWAAPQEHASRGVNLPLLSRIAEVSGGRLLAPAETVTAPAGTSAAIALRPWLALGALAVFLLRVVPAAGGARPKRRASMTGRMPPRSEAA